jgi:hypothetical protein
MTAHAEPLSASAGDTEPPSAFPCGCTAYTDCDVCCPDLYRNGIPVGVPESQRYTWTGDGA